MKYKLLILIIMIFCHIVDDYYLQGWLASAKQEDWWKQNAPDPLYKNDHVMALFMHSFSWAFSISLIPTIIMVYGNNYNGLIYNVFIINVCVHMIVDDLKANKKKINLIQDQLIHLIQIFITWIIYSINLS